MDSLRQRLETLFNEALDLPNDVARAAFLDRECAGDSALRQRVDRLLAAHAQSQAFFDDCRRAMSTPEVGEAGLETLSADEELGRCIGPYKILQRIGEGGCGVVYMAEQERPVRRRVALKIIKLGMDTKNVIARFEAERQALAMMDHPNIARVLDAGATDAGRPYFVMELVHGIRITEYCDERQLDMRQRLDLFIQVCHAIQHAHQKGIIHRDIKPSNILITHHDGVPVPKVIDFGIAKAIEGKLTEKTLFTVYGNFIGTPAYMSPEQADYSGLDIDTRSDIYSLGVLLYELLTGKTPFEQTELLAAGFDEMRKTLREREPHRPSTRLDTFHPAELTATAARRHVEPPKLQLLLKGDLDWIVMKALEKDRRRRYETANGLAMDVQRFLNHEPVAARPPSRWYRFQKLVRRNRGVFAGTSAVLLALLAGLGTATWLFMQERQMRHRAVAAEESAERSRANESELRRQAETREKITQAAFLISQGKLTEADAVAAEIVFQQPTLDGAAILRGLGQWHARQGRWQAAADRFLQVLNVDQLDGAETVAQDYLAASAVLAAAKSTNQYALFRRNLIDRFLHDENSGLAEPLLRAGLLLSADQPALAELQPLFAAVMPAVPVSVGNPRLSDGQRFLDRLTLQNVFLRQPAWQQVDHDTLTIVAGGANLWETNDEFAYDCTLVTGDFDFRMHVESISPKLDDFTRAGLMARESLERTAGRHVMVAVNANNTFQVVLRSEDGAMATSVPPNPLPQAYGSNSWVRLQRVGSIFHAYTSSNGVDWVLLYLAAGSDKPFSDRLYFGVAASAHSNSALATNILSDVGVTPAVSPNAALTLALWDYRHGRMESTTAWCRRLLAYPECGAMQSATARVILALACEESNQPEEGRRQLEQARDTIEKRFSAGLEPGSKGEGFWFDWLLARNLLKQGTNHH
ncbi:MAG TPA: serine/threonine-protein kinase [Verrucomicrobiae bacterium]